MLDHTLTKMPPPINKTLFQVMLADECQCQVSCLLNKCALKDLVVWETQIRPSMPLWLKLTQASSQYGVWSSRGASAGSIRGMAKRTLAAATVGAVAVVAGLGFTSLPDSVPRQRQRRQRVVPLSARRLCAEAACESDQILALASALGLWLLFFKRCLSHGFTGGFRISLM